MRLNHQTNGTPTELSVLRHPLWVKELITYQLDQTIGPVASVRARTYWCDRSNRIHDDSVCTNSREFDPHLPTVDELSAILIVIGNGQHPSRSISQVAVNRLAELGLIEGDADSVIRLTVCGRDIYNRLVKATEMP